MNLNTSDQACAPREGVASLCSTNLKSIREIAAMAAEVRRCVAGFASSAVEEAPMPMRSNDPSLWDQLQDCSVQIRAVRADLESVLNDVRLPGIHKQEARR